MPRMRRNWPPAARAIIHGLQGNDRSLIRPDNEPPFNSYFVDYDGKFDEPEKQGHVGDVEIWQPCDPKADFGSYAPAPYLPSELRAADVSPAGRDAALTSAARRLAGGPSISASTRRPFPARASPAGLASFATMSCASRISARTPMSARSSSTTSCPRRRPARS